ncbi:HTH-type transcriptional repressor NsrR [Anaerohalosphaera lusitana]|uniref:HTH-type transcriptional repressor NsrR n=1 Tax=Anaerohalosphaera lusitana TaxID=1936003 RepID=A0A1U9NIF0_9BACT|nr:Rrf2 family transcriptional regulator [Anaerohalosphaera lusitana]AQT67709.1 HTH-type transcriptional repressor NsrR [Anaerohalosphaera lusitana]
MDVIRRDTDYALRAMAMLAQLESGKAVSTKQISTEQQIPSALAAKLMQKLQAAGLVKSKMGPKGGFSLSKHPQKISIADVVLAIQGPVSINKCLTGSFQCPINAKCPLHKKLGKLQSQMDQYLTETTLADVAAPEDN